jgi:DNA-binding CsgD family transcriptional regulator
MLLDRVTERAALGRLVEGARAGHSGVLVMRGEPGVGKTALVEDAVAGAAGLRVARAAGVEPEMELPYAALHQLVGPMLHWLGRLPGPQRDALGVAFGLREGGAPDRFLVGLAALSLLAEAAGERPVLCVVDDAQWLDRESAQAVGFVARRLLAEPVALVVTTRELDAGGGEFGRLPGLLVTGLDDAQARELLGSVITGPVDEQVRERILAETGGNPLALLELPRALTAAELAGGFAAPGGAGGPSGLAGRIEDSFARRLAGQPAVAGRLLLLAAAEPAGDPALLWRAAGQLGIGPDAAAEVAETGLLAIGDTVTFRHPLVRSAVYRAASPRQRREAHQALAEATDARADPDRRAWHHAQAAPAPDEQVAAELEASAGRAQARGGLAAAGAFLDRAAALTLDPPRRSDRALAAAQVRYQAGAFGAALSLLSTAEAGALDALQRARADLLRAQIAFASSHGSDAPLLLLKAARAFEPLDARMARDTYLEALLAAGFAGRLAAGGGIRETAEAALAGPQATQPARPHDLLLDGMALLITEGYPAGTPVLKQAMSAFREADVPTEEALRWMWLATVAARLVWDCESWHALSGRLITTAREAGALTALDVAAGAGAIVHLFAGDLAEAASDVAEADAVTEATDSRFVPYAGLSLAAFQGREPYAAGLAETGTTDVRRRGEGVRLIYTHWAAAVLCNGLGRYEQALADAQQASEGSPGEPYAVWGLVELVEAAARSGEPQRARAAVDRLSQTTRASGTEWALGIESRSRALVGDGENAEGCYREAIDHLGRTRMRAELARAHLVYGEWLRRRRRRGEARTQLRTAHDMLEAMGMEAFASRARRELRATGQTARKRSAGTAGGLTAQEAQIAKLARDGLSNPEIGTRLFISARTAEYHLSKVFTKLGITSRAELGHVLPGQAGTAPVGASAPQPD